MKEEVMKILKMVEGGKIKAEEALSLLDAIFDTTKTYKKEGKFLKIHVEEEDGEKIKISVPLNFIKFMNKFIPKNVKEKIEEYGVDLNEIASLVQEEVPSEPLVDIESEDGERVKIWIE